MTRSTCPGYARLVRAVDRDLSQEQLDVIDDHIQTCARCLQDWDTLKRDIDGLRAPRADDFEVSEHVRSVMARLSDAPSDVARGKHAPWGWALGLVAGAALGFFAYRSGVAPEYQGARGTANSGEHTLARDVAVQAYASEPALRPLMPGSTVDADTALTAGYRNLGVDPVYLLLFAVDARSTVHWISPAYLSAREDPLATRLPVGADERLLPQRVVFENLAPGRLRIVAVMTTSPSHVSDIEALEAEGANTPAIMRRLPGAEVREWGIQVRDARGGGEP
jgi:hypothetical protein